MSFSRDASVYVFVVLVLFYPVAQDIHGCTGSMAKMVAILQSADDDAGENVACARELYWDFVVGQEKVFLGEMIVARHGMLTIHDTGSDEHGVGADGSQFINQVLILVLRDAFCLVCGIGEETSLGIIRKTEVRHT